MYKKQQSIAHHPSSPDEKSPLLRSALITFFLLDLPIGGVLALGAETQYLNRQLGDDKLQEAQEEASEMLERRQQIRETILKIESIDALISDHLGPERDESISDNLGSKRDGARIRERSALESELNRLLFQQSSSSEALIRAVNRRHFLHDCVGSMFIARDCPEETGVFHLGRREAKE